MMNICKQLNRACDNALNNGSCKLNSPFDECQEYENSVLAMISSDIERQESYLNNF